MNSNNSPETIFSEYTACQLCPRKCLVNRSDSQLGFCAQSDKLRAARAALHFWEEPIISGTHGSGAVFFSGCNLRCVFCQNQSIAIGKVGKEISVNRLSQIFLELQEKGANNINLVTPTPYVPHIVEALKAAKDRGLNIPIIYNCSGYESSKTLDLLNGLIDIYLPDMKYYSPELSKAYSNAPDYFEVTKLAIEKMFNQVGSPNFINPTDHSEKTPILAKGVIVRHLLLPGQTKDSKKILRYLYETYKDNIYISIMNQYTPIQKNENYPELNRRISDEEYNRVINFALKLGIENAFIQEGDTAKESFIPAFDYEGL